MTTIDDSWYDDLLATVNDTAPPELSAAVNAIIDDHSHLVLPPDERPPQRRWLVPATAAAAVLLAVGGIILIGGDSSDDRIEIEPATTPATTAPPTTTLPPATTTTPPTTTTPDTTVVASPTLTVTENGIVLRSGTTWTRESTNLLEFTDELDETIVVEADGVLWALPARPRGFPEPAPAVPLLKSTDGVTFEPVPETDMPRASDIDGAGERAADQHIPRLLVSNGEIPAVAEPRPDGLRVWVPRDTVWEPVDLARETSATSRPSPAPLGNTPVAALSPDRLVVGEQLGAVGEVVWTDFFYDLGWDSEGDLDEAVIMSGQIFPTPIPGPDGITIENPIDNERLTIPPFVPWSDLPPEALATYEWLTTNPDGDTADRRDQFWAIDLDGTITVLDTPFVGDVLLRWNGSEFEALALNQGAAYSSVDGMTWARTDEYGPFESSPGVSGGSDGPDEWCCEVTLEAGWTWTTDEGNEEQRISGHVPVDLPGWTASDADRTGNVEWAIERVIHPGDVGFDGFFTAVTGLPSGQGYGHLRTTDGTHWDANIIPDIAVQPPGDMDGVRIVETDHQSYLYWPDGTVSIAQHPTDWG